MAAWIDHGEGRRQRPAPAKQYTRHDDGQEVEVVDDVLRVQVGAGNGPLQRRQQHNDGGQQSRPPARLSQPSFAGPIHGNHILARQVGSPHFEAGQRSWRARNTHISVLA